MIVKLDHFPNFRGENKQIFELPPTSYCWVFHSDGWKTKFPSMVPNSKHHQIFAKKNKKCQGLKEVGIWIGCWRWIILRSFLTQIHDIFFWCSFQIPEFGGHFDRVKLHRILRSQTTRNQSFVFVWDRRHGRFSKKLKKSQTRISKSAYIYTCIYM